jgi:hypothetical protein
MAGGPFYCAQVSEPGVSRRSFTSPRLAQDSEITALTACMSQPSQLSTSTLVQLVQTAAQNGQIDPLSNLGRFYLYSGLFDYTVFTGVVKALQAQLLGVGVAKANISTEYSVPSGHCVSTDSYGMRAFSLARARTPVSPGNFCVLTESPWINDCLYDAVGAFLNFFYAGLQPKGALPSSINWVTVDLDNYMPSGWVRESTVRMTCVTLLWVCARADGLRCVVVVDGVHVRAVGVHEQRDDVQPARRVARLPAGVRPARRHVHHALGLRAVGEHQQHHRPVPAGRGVARES